MERKSAMHSIANGVNQILLQYADRDTIDGGTINEIRQRLNNMLERSYTHGDIVGYDDSSVEVTDYVISACVNYTINNGDESRHPTSLVMRQSQIERDNLLSKIIALSDEIEQDKLDRSFDRAMKGI